MFAACSRILPRRRNVDHCGAVLRQRSAQGEKIGELASAQGIKLGPRYDYVLVVLAQCIILAGCTWTQAAWGGAFVLAHGMHTSQGTALAELVGDIPIHIAIDFGSVV